MAAKLLKVDNPQLVTLLHDGKTLLNDSSTCEEEGLKMKSKVFCVIFRQSYYYDSDDGDDDDIDKLIGHSRSSPRYIINQPYLVH